MKKITVLLLLILAFTLFATSCSSTNGGTSSSTNSNTNGGSSGGTNTVLTPPTGTYKVTVEDPDNYVIRMPEMNYYPPYSEVTIYTGVLTDVDLEMYVNGVFECTQTSVYESDGYIWKYSFTMPVAPVTVTFKTRSLEPIWTIYPFIDETIASDITCITSKSCHGSITPTLTVFDTIYRTTDKQEILKAYGKLLSSSVYKTQGTLEGVGPDILVLTLPDATYTISAIDGVFTVDNEYYKLNNSKLYTCPNFYGYTFISNIKYMSWELFKGDEKIEDESTLQLCKNFLTQAIFTEYICDTACSLLTEYENTITQDEPYIMKADNTQEITLYSSGLFKITAPDNYCRYFKIIDGIELP